MNMKWLLIEITETVEELKAIMHSQVKAKLKERVHALYVWKAGVVFQTWILYQNPKFISVDKEPNNDVMHFVEFGETNRLSD